MYKAIDFHNTITTSKRKGAYVRNNLKQTDDGRLVALQDMKEATFDGIDSTSGLSGIIYRDYIFTENTSNQGVVWGFDKTTNQATYLQLVGKIATSACDDFNGIKFITTEGKIYWVRNGGVGFMHDFSGTDNNAKITFDGVNHYIYFDGKIYRQAGDSTPVDTGMTYNGELLSVESDTDYQILFINSYSGFTANFWDKASATDFTKIIEVKNTVFGGSAILEGKLTATHSIGNTTNPKEERGEMRVSIFDGEKFVRVAGFRTGDDDVYVKSYSSGNGIFIFSLDSNVDNHNGELFKEWLVKFSIKDYKIEFLSDAEDYKTNSQFNSVSVDYSSQLVTIDDSNEVYLYVNHDGYDNYDDYGDYKHSHYITEMIGDPKKKHTVTAFEVTLEKPFEQLSQSMNNGEWLKVYYRTSERDDFTLMRTLTVKDLKDIEAEQEIQSKRDDEYNDGNKGLSVQEFTFEFMDDNETPLPKYNEIQFKFELHNGATLLGSGFWYNIIKRKQYE